MDQYIPRNHSCAIIFPNIHWNISTLKYVFIHVFIHSVYWIPIRYQLIFYVVSRNKAKAPVLAEGPFNCSSMCHLVNRQCSTMLWLTLPGSIGFPRNPLTSLAWNRSFLPNPICKKQDSSHLCVTSLSPLPGQHSEYTVERNCHIFHVYSAWGVWVDEAGGGGNAVVSDTRPDTRWGAASSSFHPVLYVVFKHTKSQN